MLLASMMVNAIVPVIARDVGASVPQAVWMISGNLLALALGVALGSSATDVFGVRRSYLLASAGLCWLPYCSFWLATGYSPTCAAWRGGISICLGASC